MDFFITVIYLFFVQEDSLNKGSKPSAVSAKSEKKGSSFIFDTKFTLNILTNGIM
jgi:hypothetical protein